MFDTTESVLDFLRSLGARPQLIRHLELVGEAGQELMDGLDTHGIQYDRNFVSLGIAIHDAGKILHPEELNGGGNLHEPDGETLMLSHGFPAKLARVCLSHARYDEMPVSFEEHLIALADTLWKGHRKNALELKVIDQIADQLSKERWDVFMQIDTLFERIAMKGDDRLSRSQIF